MTQDEYASLLDEIESLRTERDALRAALLAAHDSIERNACEVWGEHGDAREHATSCLRACVALGHMRPGEALRLGQEEALAELERRGVKP